MEKIRARFRHKRELSDVDHQPAKKCKDTSSCRTATANADSLVFEPLVAPISTSIDTEAAVMYIENLLLENKNKVKQIPCPPVVFVHQLYDILNDKSAVNREVELLRNTKKILIIYIDSDDNSRLIINKNRLKKYLFENCNSDVEKVLYTKFFNRILEPSVDSGISKSDLRIKYKFSDNEIRLLIRSGLLILRDSNMMWYSFPNAGYFMKNILKGRKILLQIIKKKKFQEMLEQDIKNSANRLKTLSFPIMYHVHDLVGRKYVKCVETSMGRLLQYNKDFKI